MSRQSASVIVLGFGLEPYLHDCLRAVLDQLHDEDELILVDNGIKRPAETATAWPARVQVVGDGSNTGFAGGCNLGAQECHSTVLVFVNSDAILRPGALDALISKAGEPQGGIVGGCLRLADSPDLINSAGNPLQFLGVTWAGHCGEPARDHQVPGPVAVATGGLFALSRELWTELGGFDSMYFAYHEDVDLCLRAWLSGSRVRFEPSAIADHYYSFSRNDTKMYLVERNRLLTVLTDYPRAWLLAALPPLVMVEIALLVMAGARGWGRQKLRGWWWIVSHRHDLVERRRRVQAGRTELNGILPLVRTRIETPLMVAPPGMAVLNAALTAYWSVARRWVRPRG